MRAATSSSILWLLMMALTPPAAAANDKQFAKHALSPPGHAFFSCHASPQRRPS